MLRDTGFKAAGMRREPSWLMANAPLWSAGISKDARLMKRSDRRTRPALCCVIQRTEPQTPLGVSRPDPCLLYLEIWAPFWFDAPLHLFLQSLKRRWVLPDMKNCTQQGRDSAMNHFHCTFHFPLTVSFVLKLFPRLFFLQRYGECKDMNDMWFVLALRNLYQSICAISWGRPSHRCWATSNSLLAFSIRASFVHSVLYFFY